MSNFLRYGKASKYVISIVLRPGTFPLPCYKVSCFLLVIRFVFFLTTLSAMAIRSTPVQLELDFPRPLGVPLQDSKAQRINNVLCIGFQCYLLVHRLQPYNNRELKYPGARSVGFSYFIGRTIRFRKYRKSRFFVLKKKKRNSQR